MSKSDYILGIIASFTLVFSREFFSSQLFYDFCVSHPYTMQIILSLLVTFLISCIYMLFKLIVEHISKNINVKIKFSGIPQDFAISLLKNKAIIPL